MPEGRRQRRTNPTVLLLQPPPGQASGPRRQGWEGYQRNPQTKTAALRKGRLEGDALATPRQARRPPPQASILKLQG